MILFLLFIASGEVVDKSLCPNSCNNNGECTQVYETNNETMTDYTFCDCFSGFTTNDCSQCSEGRFGQLCKLCPIHNKKVCAGHGLCDGGINGNRRVSTAKDCSRRPSVQRPWMIIEPSEE